MYLHSMLLPCGEDQSPLAVSRIRSACNTPLPCFLFAPGVRVFVTPSTQTLSDERRRRRRGADRRGADRRGADRRGADPRRCRKATSSRCGPLHRASGRLSVLRPLRHATREPSSCARLRSSGTQTGLKHRSLSCLQRRRCAPWRRGSTRKSRCHSESCARRKAGTTAGMRPTLGLSHPSANSLLAHRSSRRLSCLPAISRLPSHQLGRHEVRAAARVAAPSRLRRAKATAVQVARGHRAEGRRGAEGSRSSREIA